MPVNQLTSPTLASRSFICLKSQHRLSRSQSTAAPASTSTPKYPFPTHNNPTPFQIFHIHPNTPLSNSIIKARYYDLVRTYHPDSPHARTIPSSEAHARFRAITYAYDVLSGKAPLSSAYPSSCSPYASSSRSSSSTWHHPHNRPMYTHSHTRRRAPHMNTRGWEWEDESAAYGAHGGAGMHGEVDDGMKDRVIMVVGFLSLLIAFTPFFSFPFSPLSLLSSSLSSPAPSSTTPSPPSSTPSTSSSPSTAPPPQPSPTDLFIGNAHHRAAAHNLATARAEARLYAEERRREIRKRVRGAGASGAQAGEAEGREGNGREDGKEKGRA